MKKFILLMFTTCLIMSLSVGQENNGLKYLSDDPFTFDNTRTYSREIGLKYNKPEFENHPDFGNLPLDAPVDKRVVEDLSKRTIDERYYIDLDDPTYFYIQKAAKPINFEKNGKLVAIDPRLEPSALGVYEASNQLYPSHLNTHEQFASLKIANEEFSFANYALIVTHTDNSQETFEADWSTVQVGSRGAKVVNVFPDIDLHILFQEGKVKTEFVLKNQPTFKSLRFIDNLGFDSSKFELFQETDETRGLFIREINDHINYLKIGHVTTLDSSLEKEKGTLIPYSIIDNKLLFTCTDTLLHHSDMVYPLVVDPLFTAVGPVATGFGVMGSLEAPAVCTNTLNVTFPGGSTPWDFSAVWSIYADECFYYWYYDGYWPCYTGEAQVSITSNCGGRSPATGIWNCSPGCSNPGTWNPTLPFAASGTQSLAQCYTPSCSNQTLSFSFNLDRVSGCPTFGGADNCAWNTSWCMSLDQWQVTVQGRTLETLGNTVTGNGYNAIVSSNCLGTSTLNPTPAHGVPGYSYVWSTGETAPTINVSNATAGTTYTATVTDACGSSRLATFDINCPLAVTLTAFNAIPNEQHVQLKWQTATERDHDYFVVQRTRDGEHYENIGTVKGVGNSTLTQTYSLIDANPLPGISYYRLEIVDIYGVKDYSSLESVNYSSDVNTLSLVPNPATNAVMLSFTAYEIGNYQLMIYSSRGDRVYDKTLTLPKGDHQQLIDVNGLANGVYTVQLTAPTYVTSSKLVIEH